VSFYQFVCHKAFRSLQYLSMRRLTVRLPALSQSLLIGNSVKQQILLHLEKCTATVARSIFGRALTTRMSIVSAEETLSVHSFVNCSSRGLLHLYYYRWLSCGCSSRGGLLHRWICFCGRFKSFLYPCGSSIDRKVVRSVSEQLRKHELSRKLFGGPKFCFPAGGVVSEPTAVR